MPPALFACASRPDGIGSPSGVVPWRGHGGPHGRHVDARRGHRSRRPAHPGTGMRRPVQARTRWLIVVLFAVAMAWVEAATVFYLRVMVDRVDPYQPNPLPMDGIVEPVELVREAATLVMLAAIGMLAGRNGADAPRLRGDRLRRLGCLLLRLPEIDLRLADVPVRLGRPVPAAPAVVGAGAGACLHRAADDRVGHAGHPAGRRRSRRSR